MFDRQTIIFSHSRQDMRVGKARCPTVQKLLELPNELALLLSFLLPQNNHHSESRISYLLPHIFTTCVHKQSLVSFSWSKPYVSSKCHRDTSFYTLGSSILRDSAMLIYSCSPGWPQTHDALASAFQVLGLCVCATMPGYLAH